MTARPLVISKINLLIKWERVDGGYTLLCNIHHTFEYKALWDISIESFDSILPYPKPFNLKEVLSVLLLGMVMGSGFTCGGTGPYVWSNVEQYLPITRLYYVCKEYVTIGSIGTSYDTTSPTIIIIKVDKKIHWLKSHWKRKGVVKPSSY